MAKVKKVSGHAFLRSEYSSATIISDDGSECRDLQCPKCGCDKIVMKPNHSPLDFGEEARCWECGHEFIITENCFILDTRDESIDHDDLQDIE